MWSQLISASKEIQRADYVWRYGTIPVITPENLSTHSYAVTAYSAMIHRSLNQNDPLTLSACLMYAIVHDMVETKSGDIVRTFKYRSQDLKEAIDEAEKEVIKEFDPKVVDLFETSNLLADQCGKPELVKFIVKAADFMSLHSYMTRELCRGNYEILPFYGRMVSDLRGMSVKYRGLELETGGLPFKPGDLYSALAEDAFSQMTDVQKLWVKNGTEIL